MLQSFTKIPEYLKILTKCSKNVQNYLNAYAVFLIFWERGTVTNKVESQLWMLPQMFTFLCEKRTGRIIQKIGRLVHEGRGMVGSFLGAFCLFLARISSWFIPFIPMFLSILSYLFLFLSFLCLFLLVYVSHRYLSCLSRGPQAMYFKESLSFHFRPVCLSLCLIGIYVFLPKSAHKW